MVCCSYRVFLCVGERGDSEINIFNSTAVAPMVLNPFFDVKYKCGL
jgi:hypothetical protein